MMKFSRRRFRTHSNIVNAANNNYDSCSLQTDHFIELLQR